MNPEEEIHLMDTFKAGIDKGRAEAFEKVRSFVEELIKVRKERIRHLDEELNRESEFGNVGIDELNEIERRKNEVWLLETVLEKIDKPSAEKEIPVWNSVGKVNHPAFEKGKSGTGAEPKSDGSCNTLEGCYFNGEHEKSGPDKCPCKCHKIPETSSPKCTCNNRGYDIGPWHDKDCPRFKKEGSE